MKVVFLGVGEAFDEELPNTSVWVQSGPVYGQRSIMLDCGFTVPPAYWKMALASDELDALYVSHFHGDHFFGVPALLLRFWEGKRRKPLIILGQHGVEERIKGSLDLAYPNFLSKLGFPLEFEIVEAGTVARTAGLEWSFAESGHSQRDLAVSLNDGMASIFYSGDGMPTPGTLSLARGCDLAIQEAFSIDHPIPGHGTISSSIDFAREAGVGTLALVHIQRDARREHRQEILSLIARNGDVKIIIPEPGDVVEI